MSNITASATPMERQVHQLESSSIKLPGLINQITLSVGQAAQSIISNKGYEKWLENIAVKSGYPGDRNI